MGGGLGHKFRAFRLFQLYFAKDSRAHGDRCRNRLLFGQFRFRELLRLLKSGC